MMNGLEDVLEDVNVVDTDDCRCCRRDVSQSVNLFVVRRVVLDPSFSSAKPSLSASPSTQHRQRSAMRETATDILEFAM
jgi:hypothetical protein